MQLYSFVHGYPVFLAPFIRKNTVSKFNGLCSLIWRRQQQPTPVLLPGIFHGWRCLVGYSPWGRKESDMTEQLYFHFSLSCIGEGNGNPLQCSCLENPRDGGAWWGYGPWGHKELDRTERLSKHTRTVLSSPFGLNYIYLPFIYC